VNFGNIVAKYIHKIVKNNQELSAESLVVI